MCEYCAYNKNFWAEVMAGGDRMRIIHICTPKCTHPSDQPPDDYEPPQREVSRRERRQR